MAINSIAPSSVAAGITTVTVPVANEASDSAEAKLSASDARAQAKEAKEAQSASLAEVKGKKTADSTQSTVEHAAKVQAANQALAVVSTLSTITTTETADLGSVDTNAALAQFQELAPLMGKPNGQSLAEPFSRDADDVVLSRLPRELTETAHGRVASGRVASGAATQGSAAKDRNADSRSAASELSSVLQSTKLAPGSAWAKYAQVNEAFWRSNKSALLQSQTPASDKAKLALDTLHTHLVRVKEILQTHYAPIMRSAKTARVVDDVPVIPDETVVAMENAMPIASLTQLGHLVAKVAADPTQLGELKAAMNGKAAATTPAVAKIVSAVQAQTKGFINLDTGDIDCLISLVMAECTQTEDDMLRDQLAEMQKSNNQKKAQREKENALNQANTRLDGQMHAEFNMLQSTGQVAPNKTFEDYKSFRQVAWGDGQLTDDGHWVGPAPALTEPRPPLIPDWLAKGTVAPAAGAGGTADPLIAKYGLDGDTLASLSALWKTSFPKGTPAEFNTWLRDTVKLHPVASTGKAALEDTEANLQLALAVIAPGSTLLTPKTGASGTLTQAALASSPLADYLKLEGQLDALKAAGFDVGTALLNNENNIKKAVAGKTAGADVPDLAAAMQGIIAASEAAAGQTLKAGIDSMNALVAAVGTDDPNAGWQEVTTIDHKERTGGDGDTDGFSITVLDGNISDPNILNFGANGITTQILTKDEDMSNWDSRAVCHTQPGSALSELQDLIAANDPTKTVGIDGLKKAVANIANSTGSGADLSPLTANLGLPTAPVVNANDVSEQRTGVGDAINDQLTALDLILSNTTANADGSLYGDIPAGAKQAYDALIAAGVIKQGISPQDAAAAEAKREQAESDLKSFMAGKSGGTAQDYAMKFTGSGSLADLGAQLDKAKSDLQSMGDTSEMVQMRLQSMMDARSKIVEMWSNMLKKIASTSDTLVANCK